jgi:hypothetical protein
MTGGADGPPEDLTPPVLGQSSAGDPIANAGARPPRTNRGLVVGLGVAAVVALGTAGIGGYVLVSGNTQESSGTGAASPGSASTADPGLPTASSTPSEAWRTADRDPFAGGQAVSTGSSGTSTGSSSAVTVTVTADSPTYVGLYGFVNGKADFWVNATEYTVAVGDTFGADFTYTAQTGQGCARVTHEGATETICAGEVRAFG